MSANRLRHAVRRSGVPCAAGWGAVALVVAATVAPDRAAAQPIAAPTARWQVEVAWGPAGLAADDLNARADYDAALVNYLASEPIEQDHLGDLRRLRRAAPVGGRLLRRLTPHWSVGGGFSYFMAEQRSHERAGYRFTVVDPRAQDYQRAFDQALDVNPLALVVREYQTFALVRYERPIVGRLSAGASLQAGWVVADCEIARGFLSEGGYYPTRRASTLVMSGRGGGAAAEASVLAHLALTPRIGALVEGGLAWHRVTAIDGTMVSTTETQDGEATEVERSTRQEASGRWVNQPISVQSSAGRWQGTVPSIGVQGEPFTLDLSGWRFRVGVSFAF